ncbi:hypothetical protein LXA43DRAFT_1067652 [Ganoderma leucocontextum]|nr:hypothetical protein LXA43DRAFT_1067652 [Ganoderma leucocontextum]
MNSAEELIHGIASAFKEIEELDKWVFETQENKNLKLEKKTKTKTKTRKPLQRLADDSSRTASGEKRLDLVIEDFLLLGIILENKDVQQLFHNTSLLSQLIPSQLHRLQIKTPVTAKSDAGDLKEDDVTYIHISKKEVLAQLAKAETTLIPLIERPRSHDDSQAKRCAVYDSVLMDLRSHLKSTGLPEEIANKAEEWLEKQWNGANVASESACHIHAEAGLMALACEITQWTPSKHAARDDPDSKYVTAFKGVNNVPIGINMKCCSLCFRLGQLLNAKESEVDTTFQLPDSHEVIFAWDPPSSGIPDSVLEILRNDLHDKLVRIAVNEGEQFVTRTRQSSPTSGSQPSESPTATTRDRHKPDDILKDQKDITLDFEF